MLSLEARFGRLAGGGEAVKAAGSWNASLPVLFSQPFAARLPKLAGGDASGSFEANLGDVREMLVKVAVKELALSAGPQAALPSLSSEFRADFDSEGRVTFNLPLRLDFEEHASNLVLSGTLSTQGGREDRRLPLGGAAHKGGLAGDRRPHERGRVPPGAGAGAARAPDATAPAAPALPFWPAVAGPARLRHRRPGPGENRLAQRARKPLRRGGLAEPSSRAWPPSA